MKPWRWLFKYNIPTARRRWNHTSVMRLDTDLLEYSSVNSRLLPNSLGGCKMGSLSREIRAFYSQVEAQNQMRKPLIRQALKSVTTALQSLWPSCQVGIFGSVATGLALPNSDVDLVVHLPAGHESSPDSCVQLASWCLSSEKWVKTGSLRCISDTKVPVIMLSAECTLDRIWNNNRVVHLDISFQNSIHSGEFTSHVVKDCIARFPEFVQLVVVLKQLLVDHGLDKDGLSSYCLLLLVRRFLEHHYHQARFFSHYEGVGSLFMKFLHFFGCVFEPRIMRIPFSGTQLYQVRDYCYGGDDLYVEDPFYPMENVGRNCTDILRCTEVFSTAYNVLYSELHCCKDQTKSEGDFFLLSKILPSIVPNLLQDW